jgi:hypothetical protein
MSCSLAATSLTLPYSLASEVKNFPTELPSDALPLEAFERMSSSRSSFLSKILVLRSEISRLVMNSTSATATRSDANDSRTNCVRNTDY